MIKFTSPNALMKGLLFLILPMFLFSYSMRQCQNPNNDTSIIDGCKYQENTAVLFQPLNSSIYYSKGDKKLPKRFQPFFQLSLFDPHRDGRFYKDLSVPTHKRQNMLIHIFKEFSSFTRENNLTYWLIHGGLIGWYWNQDVLPWDMDIDAMVLYHDLKFGYTKFHNTVYKDRYLFEINPNSQYREVQISDVIDARFIDKLSGLYVDITAVSYDPIKNKLHCKSPHYYDVDDIFPLRLSNFSNSEVWVPFNTAGVLEKEYEADCMTKTTFARGKRFMDTKWGETLYRFDESSLTWVLADKK